MSEHVDTVVIGGGQAGLATGYHLARQDREFVILDAARRVGDAWRGRWDSLRLFTPARYDGLPGSRYPDDPWSFPTKDEFAAYLEAYAGDHGLPIRGSTPVDRLTSCGAGYRVTSGSSTWECDNVVVAMSGYQRAAVPELAGQLDPGIAQIHSSSYRGPGQIADGAVLVVGAGNSGAEIALELAADRTVYLAGRDVGQIPFRIRSRAGRVLTPVVLRLVFHRLLTIRTPMGRRARPRMTSQGGPLIRVRRTALARAGIERVGRVAAAVDGLPVLDDGRRLGVESIVWCTGYDPATSWIDVDGFRTADATRYGGVVPSHPGLYFVGRHFQYALSSGMIHGCERDARRIVEHLGSNPVAARSETVGRG